MNRQKMNQDRKMSYEVFESGDNVYVFFPIKRIGCSPKFTGYWRGPFQVGTKQSGVLYKVNCGRSGSWSVIHCDRMWKARKQVLIGEDDEAEQIDIEDELVLEEEALPGYDDNEVDSSKRIRHKPAWTKDYILSFYRSGPNLKTTERKHCLCTFCNELVNKDSFSEHIVDCVMNREQCDICDATFKTKAYLAKHLKVKHEKPTPADTSSEKQKTLTEGCRPREPAETNQSSVNQTRVGAQDTSKTVPDSFYGTGCMQKTRDVCVIIQKDSEAVSQEKIVNNNGNRRHQMFDTLDADEKIEPTFDFGNWFPADAVIKPHDIKCRRMLNKEWAKCRLNSNMSPNRL